MNFERANDERDLDRLIDRMCDQLASADELAALGRLLSEDPAARDHYIACLELHARLAWQMTPGRPFSSEELLRYTDEQAVRGKIGSEIPDLPIAIPSLSPLASPLSPSFVGGPVFSYMVATVVLALMLLGAWAYKISHVIPSSAGVAQKQSAPAPVFVGRITGMKDCRWAEADTRMIVGASVPLGREYALTSGLMEITYKSGARVILEGPCTYKVESSAG
ncbi:MAG: hypothetical protein JW959_04695, partial [Pirellulales bacterium]|nr:hypothetical protein [Pirellulales bacterium]